jgi:DNA-binding LytR/AlgR family response regulator
MKHILIVEDDGEIQQFLKHALIELDADIRLSFSVNATDALVIAKKEQIDIFMVDIQLLDYKGTDLVKQLRSIKTYKYTPIIFETAVVTEELRAYRELKCYHYLMKPYTKEEVQIIIAEVLDFLQQPKTDERTVRIEQKGFIFEYRLREILYIESFGKKMVIHLLTQQGDHRQEKIAGYSLKAMLELLDDELFVQCHKSYILNKTHVEVIQKAENLIKLRHCLAPLPIGHKYRSQVLEY